MEKTLRVYDMNYPDATSRELEISSGSVRTISSSCTDMNGLRCVHERNVSITNKLLYVGHLILLQSYFICVAALSRLWDVRTGKLSNS